MSQRSGVLITVLALVTACAGDGEPIRSAHGVDPTTTVPITSATTTLPGATSSIATRRPVAWISPSGVPLAVTAVRGDTVEVLTPCGYPAEIAEGRPIIEVDVVIDPGHGGVDTGAVAPTGLSEKQVNMAVGRALHDELIARGIASMLTRTGDYVLPIRTRARYADLVGAEALVSIHHNAPEAPASAVPGVEIFVQHDSAESQRLGGLIYDAAMAALSGFDVDWDRAPDAGVMTVINSEGEDAYGMVRRPRVPSALVELGYIANPAEAELYASPEYAPAVAGAMADAIEAFLGSDAAGAGLVEGRVFNPRRGVGQDQCVEPDLGTSLG